MAFIKYRGNSAPGVWGSTVYANAPLSNLDIDKNFASLDAQKLNLSGGTITGELDVGTNLTGFLKDDQIAFVDGGNTSKQLTFQLSGITASTVRTLTVQDKSGTIALTSDVPVTGITATTLDSELYLTIASAASGTQALYTNTSIRVNPSTGTISATNFNSTSDINFKKDLEVITGALDKVTQLTGYTFTMIESGERSSGLIAQDLELVLPEAVGGNLEKKTVSYGAVMGLIVEALKELNDKVEDLQNQLKNK